MNKSSFETKLIRLVTLKPKRMIGKIGDNLSPTILFENKYNRFIYQAIIEYNKLYESYPKEEMLVTFLTNEYGDHQFGKIIIDHLEEQILSMDLSQDEINYIEDNLKGELTSSMFHRLKNEMDKMSHEKAISFLNKILKLQESQVKYELSNLYDELEDDERIVIPTDLELIDDTGLAKGELGVLLAGTGIGKSVFLTFLANNFMLSGYKVLHLVFEGSKSSYLRSHRRKLGNPTTEELENSDFSENLKVIKMKSNATTTKDLEWLIDEMKESYDFTPDVLVIDYIDCFVGPDSNKEGWQNDITIINEMENISQKYNVVIWTAIQSNRSGLNKPLGLDNVSGSIQKLQKATLVLTLMRDEFQQSRNQATLQIKKNRFGILKDSVDCTWNPETMEIDAPITEPLTL